MKAQQPDGVAPRRAAHGSAIGIRFGLTLVLSLAANIVPATGAIGATTSPTFARADYPIFGNSYAMRPHRHSRPPTTLALACLLAIAWLAPSSAALAASPPAPQLLAPASGAKVLVPFTISWSAVSDPSGIVAYNWQVSPSSSFNPVIKLDSTSGATQATVSGLAKGTYFWRVQAVNGNFVQGTWSAARSFSVTGVGPDSPGTPTLNPPQGGPQFHPLETVTFTWTPVSGADSYVFEASTDKNFPVATIVHINNIPDTTYKLAFGDSEQGNWLARVYAVSASGIEGVPSNRQSFSVFYSNPVPPPPTPIAPVGGVTVDLPVTLSWTDVPNPQDSGYEIQIATDSGFRNIEEDVPQITPNQREVLSLTSGTKFWRVRSFQGSSSPTTAAVTAWSTTASFTVSQGPVRVTGITLTRAPDVFSGEVEDGRIQLSSAAPAGGTVVSLASSDPTAAPVPASVTVPAGFAVSPSPFQFTVGQVTTVTPVTVTATTGSSSTSIAITVQPPSLKTVSVPSTITGGAPVSGILLLNGTAPAGGATVALTSDSAAVTVPPSVTIAGGATSTSFDIATRAVTTTTTATITAAWKGGSVSAPLTLTPQQAPGSISLSPTTTDGTNGASGTVTLASPADHDVQILLSSSNPAVATVPPYVTVPRFAGGGGFFVTTSNPSAPTTVTITASGAGVTKSATLTVNPFATGPSMASLALNPAAVSGGSTSTATVTLSSAAPSGGASVAVASSNTAVASVPAQITVPAGAMSATFSVTSKTVVASASATISASYGGSTRTAVLTVSPGASSSDTVSISRVEYDGPKRELSVEAMSTSSSATLKVYVASTGELIGTLANDGGGRYRGQFMWPSNPQSIVVGSSLGGSATMTVTLK